MAIQRTSASSSIRSSAALALALGLLASGCTPYGEIAPDTIVTCTTAADCPKGQVCNRDRCVAPEEVGTPPELVGGKVTVSADRVKAGDTFTVAFEATKALEGAPGVTLAFEEPAALTCASSGVNRWSCPYAVSADGQRENGGKGGRVSIDVHMVDLSGNVANRNGVGSVELDFAAPVLAAQSVEPSNVPRGGVIQVFVTASEDLRSTPVLGASRELEPGGGTRFPLVRQGETRNYVFTHLVTPSDLPGPLSFTAEMTDLVGNVSPRLAVGAISVDNIVPVIASLSATPSRLGKSGVLTVAFNVSKAIAEARVTVGTLALACTAGTGTAWSCTHSMTGTEIAEGTEASQSLVVEVADAAGNRALATSAVVFDFAAPALPAPNLPSAPAPLGGTLQLVLTPSEALGAHPVLVASRALSQGTGTATRFTLAPQAGTLNYVFSHAVTASDPLGSVGFTLEMADLVGNATTATVGSVSIDNVPPVVSALTVNAAPIGKTGTATAGFTVSKTAASVQATVGGRAMTCTAGPSNAWTCRWPMTGTEIADGTESSQAVVVDVADPAGNRGLGTSRVTFDFAPPTLPSPGLPGGPLPLGGVLDLVLAPGEPLGANPVLVASRALDDGAGGRTRFTLTPQAGTSTYVFAHLVTSADPLGATTFTLEMTDRAGNSAVATAGTVSIDNLPPTLSGLAVNTTPIGKVGTATANFTVSKAVPTAQATVGGRTMTCTAGAGNAWTCTRPMLGNEITDGTAATQNLVVSAVDAAGNRDSATASVTFDFAPPAVASASVPSTPLALATNLQVVVTASERLGQPPVLVASRPLREGGVDVSRFTLAAQGDTLNYALAAPHTVVAGDPQGTIVFTAEMTDQAGNSATRSVGSVNIDSVVPQVTGLAVSSSDAASLGSPLRLRAGVTLRANFDTSEAGPAPVVSVSGRALTCGARQATSPNYTCTRAVATGDVAAGMEVTQTVLVSFADGAGNATTASVPVVYDFKAPVITLGALAYVPAAGNPLESLAAIASAKTGTSVRVLATSDETLAGVPAMSPGSQALPFTSGGFGGTSVTLQATVGSQADGAYVTTFSAVDLAGNPASFAVGPVAVRTSTPVLTVNQAQVTYLRSPWGNASAESLGAGGFTMPAGPYFALAPADPMSSAPTLPAGAFTIASGNLAAIRVWSDQARSALLGSVPRNTGGDWPRATLQNVDLTTVWVTGLDDAGNESTPPRRIDNVEWVATANPGVAASNAVDVTTYASEALIPSPETTVTPPAGLGGLGGSRVTATAHIAMRRIAGGSLPPARSDASLAYDSGRGRFVLFGGQNGGSFSDTWEFDGTAWTDRTPSGVSPPARSGAAMAYDAARGRVVLYGGYSRDDTWEWDGASWKTFPNANLPGYRYPAAMAYDPVRRVVVLFGGVVGDARTFEWDGAQWTADVPGNPSPPGAPPWRYGHSMAFDVSRGRLVMYGGDGPSGVLSDVWERNGTTWSQVVAQGGSLPGPRSSLTLVYDARKRRIVLFGGRILGTNPQSDVREWDGATWSLLTPATALVPAARSRHVAAFDPASSTMVVFGGGGGSSGNPGRDDTWAWDGAAWTRRATGVHPQPDQSHAMAYDEQRGRVVLFGSSGGNPGKVWEWDGHTWVDATPAAGPPAPTIRLGAAAAYDRSVGRVVLFGGLDATNVYWNDVWEWSGTAWTRRTTTGGPPPGRWLAGLAYDWSRSALVLHGGMTSIADLADTWELTASATPGVWNWTQRALVPPTGFAANARHAMFYDGTRTLASFGDLNPPKVWQWNGTAWTDVTPASMPAGGLRAMAFDPVRGRAQVSGIVSTDLWEWTGSAFLQQMFPDHATLPPSLKAGFMTFDAGRSRAVAFDGDGQTWEWDGELAAGTGGPFQRRAPAVQLTAAYPGTSFTPASVSRLRVRGRAGGRYGASGTGAQLLGWRTGGVGIPGGAWVTLSSNVDGTPLAAAPAGTLPWEAPAADIPFFFVSRDARLAFQLRPAGASRATEPESTVDADYLEVRVRYTAP